METLMFWLKVGDRPLGLIMANNAFGVECTGYRLRASNDGKSWVEHYPVSSNCWVWVCILRRYQCVKIFINAVGPERSACTANGWQHGGDATPFSDDGFYIPDPLILDDFRLADEDHPVDIGTFRDRFENSPLIDRARPEQHETCSWLYDHRNVMFSQFGEDGILGAIFERIGEMSRCCLEVGAGDGIKFCNTRRFYLQGWTAIYIESDKSLLDKVAQNATGAVCRLGAIAPTGETSLDTAIFSHTWEDTLDLLCLDIDGGEYQIWQHLKHRPRVLMIEHAFDLRDPDYVPPEFGHGPEYETGWRAIENLAHEKGYKVVARTPCNSICVIEELYERLA